METIIAAIGTLLGIVVVQYFTTKRQKNYLNVKFDKQDKDNVELNKKISDIDTSQNKEIAEIKETIKTFNTDLILKEIVELKNEVKYLNDLHKYSKYLKQLTAKIEEISDSILALKEFKQKEIVESLISGREKSLKIFSYIIEKEFEIDEIKIKEQILVYLKAVKLQINDVKLCLQRPSDYLQELEEYLRNIVDNYIIELKDVKKLLNGDRRKTFEKISINMIKSVYLQTIDLYNQYKINHERAA